MIARHGEMIADDSTSRGDDSTSWGMIAGHLEMIARHGEMIADDSTSRGDDSR